MSPAREHADSTSIRRSSWDPATQTLTIEFHQGRVYDYHDVSYEEWTAFAKADSAGGHLRAVIMPKHIASERVGGWLG